MKSGEKMAEYKLPKDFFENNLIKPYSAPQFFLVTQIIEEHERLNSKFQKLIAQFNEEAMAKDEAQLRLIEETDDPAVLVNLMRKNLRLPNVSTYIGKVLTYQSECLPLLLKRYLTSGQDTFIETSARVLVASDESYVRQLQEMYGRIRNPYARAVACFVFGQRGMKEMLAFLVGEYENFKRNYNDESFEQFPLAAIYLLNGRSIL